MKDLYETLSNRFGNTLALINLLLIAFNASGLTLKLGLFAWVKFAFLVSVPARLASALLFGEPLLSYWANRQSLTEFTLPTLILVYLQWVLIGCIAQKLSRAFQPPVF